MDDIRPKLPAASVRLFDPLRRHRRDHGYAWKTEIRTHVLNRGAMGVLSPLDSN